MSLPRYAVSKPVFVNLVSIAFVVLGMYSLATLPQEQFPEVSFPWAFVTVIDPGVSPREIEKTIVLPLEEQLENLDDLDSITSTAREGGAFIWLKFETMPDDDFQLRLQDVRAAVNKVDLPASAEEPDVEQFKTQDFAPVVSLVLLGDLSEHQMKELAEDLADDLRDIDNVSKALISGIREREVRIEVDPARLERFGLTLDDVVAAVRGKHLNLTGGDLKTGRMDFRLRTVGEAERIAELADVIVRASPGGGHVRVGDLAAVIDGFEDEETRARFNGKPAVTITVSKKQEGNSLRIIAAAKEVAGEYRRDRLPAGAEIVFTNDSSIYIEDILGTLKTNAWMGMVLVAVSMFVFLGWRQATFAVIGIPLALALTFGFLRFTGNTVNGSTLFGLVLVLGMLVDDAVVVIENCFRYMERGMPARRAAVVGTREVMIPVLTSAGTTVAAFLPLMLLPGVIGDFMRVIPVVVSLALAASLLESFGILPSHIAEWSGPGGGRPPVGFAAVRRLYRRLLRATIRRRYLVVGLTTLVILGSLPVIGALGVDMFADEEVPFFFVFVTLPEGTRLDATDEILARVEQGTREVIPEADLKYVRTVAGVQERDGGWEIKPSVGQLVIELKTKGERELTLDEVVSRFRTQAELVPGIEALEVIRAQSGPPAGPPIELKIRGEHLDELQDVADELQEVLRNIDGVVDIRDDFLVGVPELRVDVNEEKAAMLGLDVSRIAATVYAAFQGQVATEFLDGDDDIEVVVRLNEDARAARDDLANLRVVTPAGDRLLLKDVARIREADGYSSIKHDGTRRSIMVTADVDAERITGIAANERALAAWPAIAARHPGYDIKPGGEFKEFQEAFRNLGLLFAFGIALMFLIMAAQFNSVTQPIMIFMAVVFAFWGAIIGLFLIGSQISINNLFGLVALAGVAVNNSIVLISFVNNLREQGAGRLRAVLKAGDIRVRPILLTSITTVVGLLPMALGLGGYSEVWGPLAVVMVFGLTASSVLSLFLIPSLYLIFGDLKRVTIRRGLRDESVSRAEWKDRIERRRQLADADHTAPGSGPQTKTDVHVGR